MVQRMSKFACEVRESVGRTPNARVSRRLRQAPYVCVPGGKQGCGVSGVASRDLIHQVR